MYNKSGKQLPEGWALGADGHESTDAPAVLANIVGKKGGGIMPLGGNKEVNGSHKGYGYGMLCEIFSSILSMGVTSDKCCTFKDKTGICHGFAAIDPAIFGNADDIKAHFSEYLETLRQSPKAEGAEQIYTHGEKEIMAEVHVLDHPLIQHKLAILRSKDTPVKEFRELIGEIAGLMCYEATRKLPLKEVEVETPVATAKCHMLSGKKLAIVPVLRAGLGMVDQMVALIPSAKIGHIGLYRDPETHKPVEYYCKLPEDIANRQVFVVDPMLATGGSAVAAIDFLKKHGCKNIIMMNIIGAPEGVAAVQKAHPDVEIYLAALDEKLNEHAYIVPGLGDAGDRIFGTK